MNREEIEKEIASLQKVVNNLPVKKGGKILMKIANLKRQLQSK